jgi:hypothetical protein
VLLKTPSLEPPVGDKCNCHEWEELIPEFAADFARVHKLGGGRLELAREATAVRATGEKEAIHALIAAHHNKFAKRLSDLQLSLMSQNHKACKRIAGGGKTAKGEAAACLLLVNYCHLVRGAHADQLGEFEAEAAEMLPTARSLANAAEAERPEVEKEAKALADAEAERRATERRKKKGKAKKCYAVAVGRSTGLPTPIGTRSRATFLWFLRQRPQVVQEPPRGGGLVRQEAAYSPPAPPEERITRPLEQQQRRQSRL